MSDPSRPGDAAGDDNRLFVSGRWDPHGDAAGDGAAHGAEQPEDATNPVTGDPHGTQDPAPPAAGPEPRRRSGTASFLRELPILLLVALVLAFLLRTFVLQVFYIPSSSMEPTLSVNDRMVVEKITYRFRDPLRGEIVVFEGDSFQDTDPDRSAGQRLVRGVGQFLGLVPASARDFVKRVIGLPGDVVEIQQGQVLVNGIPIDEPYVAFDDLSDYGPVTVPEGTLFFLGDNRPNSSDSRRGLGFVPEDQVVGRSLAIIWPPEHLGGLTGVRHLVEEEPAAVGSQPVVVSSDSRG